MGGLKDKGEEVSEEAGLETEALQALFCLLARSGVEGGKEERGQLGHGEEGSTDSLGLDADCSHRQRRWTRLAARLKRVHDACSFPPRAHLMAPIPSKRPTLPDGGIFLFSSVLRVPHLSRALATPALLMVCCQDLAPRQPPRHDWRSVERAPLKHASARLFRRTQRAATSI